MQVLPMPSRYCRYTITLACLAVAFMAGMIGAALL